MVTFNRVSLGKTALVLSGLSAWWIAQLDFMKTKPVSIFEAVFFSHQQNSSVLSHVSWVYIKLHLCSPPSLSDHFSVARHFVSLDCIVSGVSLCAGQRSHVKPANRKRGGSLLADGAFSMHFLKNSARQRRNAEENLNICLVEFFLYANLLFSLMQKCFCSILKMNMLQSGSKAYVIQFCILHWWFVQMHCLRKLLKSFLPKWSGHFY